MILIMAANTLFSQLSQVTSDALQYFHSQLEQQGILSFTKEKLNLLSSSDAALLTVVFLLFIVTCKLYRKSRKCYTSEDCSFEELIRICDLAKTAYRPGHTDAVIQAVERTWCDVNKPCLEGNLSLFLCSCLSGERDLIYYMLKKGGDVRAVTSDMDSVLYIATFGILNSVEPDTQILTDLVQAGCKVNQQNRRGFTPLHRAASKGNIQVITRLLKHGADPYLANHAGVYPIDSATNAGNLDAAELLKIKVDTSGHVWDVVDPHTPVRIQLGLQSPRRTLLLQSPQSRRLVSTYSST